MRDMSSVMRKGSHLLIGDDHYCQTYNRLKSRYGQQLTEMWTKYETTEPKKFVFEDIAIASYLIVLWEQRYSQKRTSFVDIGCGNGLLVYLLCCEGHRGIGIDLRRRKVWDKYDNNIEESLIERSFTPKTSQSLSY